MANNSFIKKILLTTLIGLLPLGAMAAAVNIALSATIKSGSFDINSSSFCTSVSNQTLTATTNPPAPNWYCSWVKNGTYTISITPSDAKGTKCTATIKVSGGSVDSLTPVNKTCGKIGEYELSTPHTPDGGTPTGILNKQ